MTRCLNPRWQCLNPTWQSSRWLSSSNWVRMNKWSFVCKMAESKMAEFKMDAEFKIAAIIKLSQNEWVKVFFVQNGWIQNGRIQYHCNHQVESEWMSEVYFCKKWLNPRWLPSSSWVRMNDFESDWISWSQSFEENAWIQDGRIEDSRIQYGCHHQVKWEWMSLSQIELVGVRVLRKMAESKMAEFKMAEFKMAEYNISAIIMLSENEWVWVRLN